jgi:hypothetical protein
MTNYEALRANISDVYGVVLSQNHFRKALVDVGLAPEELYTSSSLINRATLTLYDMILAGANLSEGNLSYNLNIEGLKKVREELADSLGIKEIAVPTVDNCPRW